MATSLAEYLCSQAFMKVLRGLYSSSRPRHLRDLVRQYGLSPAGVSDILRRLEQLGLVHVTRVKNRKGYSLSLSPGESELLEQLFTLYEQELILRRIPAIEKRAGEKLQWMDEAYKFYREVKEVNAHPIRSAQKNS